MITNYEYTLSGAVVDDEEPEGEEGFILIYSFNPTAIDPIDYRRLQIGHAATLIKIADSVVCELLCKHLSILFINNKFFFQENNYCILENLETIVTYS